MLIRGSPTAAIWGCFSADLKLKGLGLPLKSPSLSRYPEDGLKPQLCRSFGPSFLTLGAWLSLPRFPLSALLPSPSWTRWCKPHTARSTLARFYPGHSALERGLNLTPVSAAHCAGPWLWSGGWRRGLPGLQLNQGTVLGLPEHFQFILPGFYP